MWLWSAAPLGFQGWQRPKQARTLSLLRFERCSSWFPPKFDRYNKSRLSGAYVFLINSGKNCYSGDGRSEEHTSELQSQSNLVCRLLLEKKKKKNKTNTH